MLAALGKIDAAGGFTRFGDFKDSEGFERLMRRVAAKTWVVFAKKPFREVGHVLRYLGGTPIGSRSRTVDWST